MPSRQMKERAPHFTPAEQGLIVRLYEEYKETITMKGNTAAVIKIRESGWQRITDRINGEKGNVTGVRRTWQQVKLKYKNLQSAKKRAAAASANARHPHTISLRLAEGRVSPMNAGANEGIPAETPNVVVKNEAAGSSWLQVEDEKDSCLIESTAKKTCTSNACCVTVLDEEEDQRTRFTRASNSADTAVRDQEEDVTSIYRRFLLQEIEVRRAELEYRRLKMRKLELEMRKMEHDV